MRRFKLKICWKYLQINVNFIKVMPFRYEQSPAEWYLKFRMLLIVSSDQFVAGWVDNICLREQAAAPACPGWDNPGVIPSLLTVTVCWGEHEHWECVDTVSESVHCLVNTKHSPSCNLYQEGRSTPRGSLAWLKADGSDNASRRTSRWSCPSWSLLIQKFTNNTFF